MKLRVAKFTFIEARLSPIAILVMLDIREQSHIWGEIYHVKIMVASDKLVANGHNA